MRCPYCDHDETQVVETRESDEGGVIRRRRRCLKCDKRFTTYERVEIALPALVKKDGSRVEFDPAKLRASMSLALRKRPVGSELVDAAIRLLDKRGITPERIAEAKELIAEARDVGDVDDNPPMSTDPADTERAVEALWAFYLQWSKLARLAITSRAELRKLGFLQGKRSSKKDTEVDVPAPNESGEHIIGDTTSEQSPKADASNSDTATPGEVMNG